MKNQPNQQAVELLKNHFMRNGKIFGADTDTSSGNAFLWGQLHNAGLVVNKGRGILGHPFSITLTDAGRIFLESLN